MGVALAGHSIGQAQVAGGSADVNPSAPLDPLPDLGVDWPEIDTSPQGADQEPTPERQSSLEDILLDEDPEREIRFALTIEGLDDVGSREELLAAFDEQSALRDEGDEVANSAQLDRRSRADAELLEELLRSRGHYDARVEPELRAENNELQITLLAEPGPEYRFVAVELPGLENAGAEAAVLREAFAVKEGDPVDAQQVIAAGVALQVELGERGFALAELGDREITINHETNSARLVQPVDPGPIARFGTIRVAGRPALGAGHVARIARFEPGDVFEQSKVDDLRRALVATGLVSAVDVEVVPTEDRQAVDIAVSLEPAPMRTIAGELGYGTGEGARLEASWQHRNFFNPEGALTLRAVAGTREQLVAANVRRNNFMRRDQVLNLLASASNSNLNAYEAKTLLLSAGLERQSNIIWHKKWTWSIGAELLATDERGVFADFARKETRAFLIGALPASLYYDGSDDLLDPTEGFRLGGRISPEISARGGSANYLRLQIDGSAYRPVSDTVVAAGRVRLGSILGASLSQLAPSRRHYSGGGGSVRGFGYQKIGPRDGDGDPIGGRGLAEFALEARVRLKLLDGNFGVVPFVDGGSLSTDAWPDLGRWRIGAGLGLRYHSRFGPIRIDVGTPLNPQSGDSRIAVTVALGQAF